MTFKPTVVLIVVLSTLFTVMISLCQVMHGQEINCPPGLACNSFNQLRKAHDEVIQDSDLACFYTAASSTDEETHFTGPNPESELHASLTADPPTGDEFFLLMDGKKSPMQNGKYPGIFFRGVVNGIPESGWNGYGPEHGDIADAYKPDFNHGQVLVSTFDDTEANLTFSTFQYACLAGSQAGTSCNNDKYPDLFYYQTTAVHKSTGRFIHKEVRVQPLYGGYTNTFTGQCIALNHNTSKKPKAK